MHCCYTVALFYFYLPAAGNNVPTAEIRGVTSGSGKMESFSILPGAMLEFCERGKESAVTKPTTPIPFVELFAMTIRKLAVTKPTSLISFVELLAITIRKLAHKLQGTNWR